MSDETYSFSTAKSRLDEIVTQVRKKDTSLEKSLDLLEEGVRLANACTELIDHADWTAGEAQSPAADGETAAAVAVAAERPEIVDGAPLADDVAEGEEAAEPVAEAAKDAPEASASEPTDAEFAPDDDAYGDGADEAWADTTPDFADEDSAPEPESDDTSA
jgi:exodeoxyribonuclease VII small subunit